MKSLRELYRIGRGPSSSHTMGPGFAAQKARELYPGADNFKVTLYGSLSSTGKGHGTDVAIREALAPVPCEIVFSRAVAGYDHPNTMDLAAFAGQKHLGTLRAVSVGGGAVRYPDLPEEESPEVYRETSFAEIARVCRNENLSLSDYVFDREDRDFPEYLKDVWRAMQKAVERGLAAQGELPGGLGVQRRAKELYSHRSLDESQTTMENRLVCSYAFAAAEENAAMGIVATAPTCGASGVIPAVMYYYRDRGGLSEDEIIRGLAAGGIIGNLVKTNASISGAECGCQAEIGTACSMCAAALAELYHMPLGETECAAENAMEHMLGLTCDPVAGLVQIPCIERNAVAAMRAINAVSLASFLTDTRKISFDLVVETMYETGRDINIRYKETSRGGLAQLYLSGPRPTDA